MSLDYRRNKQRKESGLSKIHSMNKVKESRGVPRIRLMAPEAGDRVQAMKNGIRTAAALVEK